MSLPPFRHLSTDFGAQPIPSPLHLDAVYDASFPFPVPYLTPFPKNLCHTPFLS